VDCKRAGFFANMCVRRIEWEPGATQTNEDTVRNDSGNMGSCVSLLNLYLVFNFNLFFKNLPAVHFSDGHFKVVKEFFFWSCMNHWEWSIRMDMGPRIIYKKWQWYGMHNRIVGITRGCVGRESASTNWPVARGDQVLIDSDTKEGLEKLNKLVSWYINSERCKRQMNHSTYPGANQDNAGQPLVQAFLLLKLKKIR
jgi:hypothetical protein